jgi:shikimate kinase
VADTVHVALVGLPGAGKTTVAREVGALLSRPVLDFDHEIEQREGRSIAEIFAQFGEEYFRSREAALTEEVRHFPPAILSPGGGWMTRASTVALIRPVTRLVWLQVSPRVALARLGGNPTTRPLLMKGNPEDVLSDLTRSRGPLYREADAAIDTEVLTLQEVVRQVAQLASFWTGGVG